MLLKKVRTAAKARLTIAANRLSRLTSASSREDFVLAQDHFQEKLKLFDEAQEAVEALIVDEENLLKEIEEGESFREEKQSVLAKAMNVKNENSKDSRSSISDDLSVSSTSRVSANLPKLTLPTFSGDLITWQSFYDSFISIIDLRKDLSDIDKFQYLLSSLRDEAKHCLQGLPLTSANYSVAKELLEGRFGRKEKIVQQHIQCLLNVSNRKGLWKLYDEIQVHVRSLANLGVEGDNYGLVLAPIILHQLPSEIRLEWSRKGEGKEGNFAELLDFLYSEIQHRERSQVYDSSKHEVKKPQGKPSAAALVSHQKTGPRCAFCRGEHWSDQCPDIKDLNHEQRFEKIKKMNLCFLCLGSHKANKCSDKRSGKPKVCFYCKGNHHQVLCKKRTPVSSEKSDSPCEIAVSPTLYSKTDHCNTLMQVVKTKIKDTSVNVLFDSGSDRSFISKTCVKSLKLKPVDNECLSFCPFGQSQSGNNELRNVFQIYHNNEPIRLIEIPTICSTMYRAPVPKDIISLFTGKNVQFNEDFVTGREVKIDILIGLDFYWPLILDQKHSCYGLVAQDTVFGWMLSGTYQNEKMSGKITNQNPQVRMLFCQTATEVNTMWDLDSIGIKGKSEIESECSIEEKFMNTFNEAITFGDGRYEVSLPWKSEDHKNMIVNNVRQAEMRLQSLQKRLCRTPELRQAYQQVFVDLEADGIIEEVNLDQLPDNPVFYLPHRPVVREASLSTKVRPVFDASAKGDNGVSLNDCMTIGPKLLPDLFAVLLRFRRWQFGLTADIQKAFLQISLAGPDCDVHRFLLMEQNGSIRHMRFKRVTFGNSASPFILNAVIKYHLAKFSHSEVIDELKANLYVDDWLTGADSQDTLMAMMAESSKILKEGGFFLTKWASNSSQVQQEVQKCLVQHDVAQVQKVLGMTWNTTVDCFNFETKAEKNVVFTKRSLLRLIARQFDPIGLLTPFTIGLKILFQEVWQAHHDWDVALPPEVQTKIQAWVDELEGICQWNIPRRLTKDAWSELSALELFVFCDASEKAYGTCIYLMSSGASGPQMRLVTSKVRVAPLKKISLPRLELLSALL